jgi:hypothetical protein
LIFFMSMNKNNKVFFVILTISSIAFLSGCQNAVTPIIPLKPGEMQATVSGFGTFYTTNAHAIDGGSNSTYSIHASVKTADGLNDSVVFDFNFTKLTITPYTVDFTDPISYMNYCITHTDGSCSNYRVENGTGSGILKVTSITANDNIQGTFSGTFQSTTGGGNITVTGGEFYASF